MPRLQDCCPGPRHKILFVGFERGRLLLVIGGVFVFGVKADHVNVHVHVHVHDYVNVDVHVDVNVDVNVHVHVSVVGFFQCYLESTSIRKL